MDKNNNNIKTVTEHDLHTITNWDPSVCGLVIEDLKRYGLAVVKRDDVIAVNRKLAGWEDDGK